MCSTRSRRARIAVQLEERRGIDWQGAQSDECPTGDAMGEPATTAVYEGPHRLDYSEPL